MTRTVDLLRFIPRVSPRFTSPRHLRPVSDVFSRIAAGEQVRVLLSLPPRHSKTESLLHGIAWLLAQRPELRICYASYQQRVSDKKSARARDLSRRAGAPLEGSTSSKRDWRTGVDEGGLWATSVAGPITGEGFELVLADDLLKGRAAAESGIIRSNCSAWLRSDVLTRLEPGGSIIVSGTRWHADDPIGRLTSEGGWEVINLPALALDGDPLGRAPGEPLWPERWTLPALERLRESLGGPEGYDWLSLYQGQPASRSSRVFGDVVQYGERPPTSELQITIGLDFAYSAKKSADASAAVVLGLHVATGMRFVIEVLAVREPPATFLGRVLLLCGKFPSATAATWSGPSEGGTVEYFRAAGVPITSRTATADKFSRAVPTAAAWNTGKILLPASAPWLDAFVSEVVGFSGLRDRHDDQVDALVAAYDAASVMPAMGDAAWAERDYFQSLIPNAVSW